MVDTALADPSTGGVVLVVQVPRPWDAADHGRLKKKIAAYLSHIGGDGLSASSPDWPRGTTTIAIHAAETPPDAFAPLWDRYAFTLRAQYGLGFEVTVTHGANEAETIVESPGHAGTDVHGALRGGRAFAEHVLGRMQEDPHFGTAELVDATNLHFTREGAGFDVSLDNAWRECRGKGPEALTKVVSKYLAAWSGAGAGEGEAAARLFPVLRPIARVAEIEALQQQHGALAAPEIHEPFSREIVLSYVLDSEQALASLSPEEADELADSWDALHDLAVGNLFRHVKDSLQVHTLEEGIFMVAAGGNYESGLLCIAPVWRQLAATVPSASFGTRTKSQRCSDHLNGIAKS
ncbi:MAG: hypothetical protein P1V36_08695 [Planctomycetota bacterium]|nr:hypothetical protein [Planctomycetota bacterium]